MLTLSNRTARRLILQLQGLSDPPHRKLDAVNLHELVCQLGLVQVDSIRWVQRAHHMILFSRCQHYRPADLRHLIEDRRWLFENYTHDASVLPAEYYRYWRHRFARDRDRLRQRMIKWQGDGFVKHCSAVLRKIRRDGAVRSRDLQHHNAKDTSAMWQWHDGKAALEFLWRTGKLGIAARDGFQKVYDLAERVIGADDYAARCSRSEFINWSCRSALRRLGFATAAEIAGYWNHVSPDEVNQWLSRPGNNAAIKVAVENADGTRTTGLFARDDIEALASEVPPPPARIRALSPFDPVMRNRIRVQRLFDFQYRIEIYVPAAKREYGYYIFPLLEADRLIGRIDIRADKQANCLEIKRLWMEAGCRLTTARRQRLDQELSRLAKLADVDSMVWLK
jgi:uncharacterized protein YcaQ